MSSANNSKKNAEVGKEAQKYAAKRRRKRPAGPEKYSKSFYEDFRLVGMLGRGAFGTVFLVKRHYDNKNYAIKVSNFRQYKISQNENVNESFEVNENDRENIKRSKDVPAFRNLSDARESDMQHALDEVRLMSSLRHPNVVKYKEAFFDQDEEQLCLVMEHAN